MGFTVQISDIERAQLAAILGMLGSDAVGERDNAARLAEKFRRKYGATWLELLTPPPRTAPQPDPAPAPHPAADPAAPSWAPPGAKRDTSPPPPEPPPAAAPAPQPALHEKWTDTWMFAVAWIGGWLTLLFAAKALFF